MADAANEVKTDGSSSYLEIRRLQADLAFWKDEYFAAKTALQDVSKEVNTLRSRERYRIKVEAAPDLRPLLLFCAAVLCILTVLASCTFHLVLWTV